MIQKDDDKDSRCSGQLKSRWMIEPTPMTVNNRLHRVIFAI